MGAPVVSRLLLEVLSEELADSEIAEKDGEVVPGQVADCATIPSQSEPVTMLFGKESIGCVAIVVREGAVIRQADLPNHRCGKADEISW